MKQETKAKAKPNDAIRESAEDIVEELLRRYERWKALKSQDDANALGRFTKAVTDLVDAGLRADGVPE